MERVREIIQGMADEAMYIASQGLDFEAMDFIAKTSIACRRSMKAGTKEVVDRPYVPKVQDSPVNLDTVRSYINRSIEETKTLLQYLQDTKKARSLELMYDCANISAEQLCTLITSAHSINKVLCAIALVEEEMKRE